MNKRIQELTVIAIDTAEYPAEQRYRIEPNSAFCKKFAELIVQECMSICNETQTEYRKHRQGAIDFTDKNIYAEGEAASDVIKYKIKKRFEVA